jgi:hypothetical protein
VSVRLDELEEVGEVVVQNIGMDQFFALPVHDADVHLVRVQIDGLLRARSVGLAAFAWGKSFSPLPERLKSAVVFGGGGIVFHCCIQ